MGGGGGGTSVCSEKTLLLVVNCSVELCLAENRKILHEQETEKMLIHLLSHESPDVQTAAAQGLAIMSENLISRDSIREWGKVFQHMEIKYGLNDSSW